MQTNNKLDSVYWFEEKIESSKQLLSDTWADAVVVGGGMSGLSCADQLQKNGLRVIILEKSICGSQASGKSSGFITPDSELELSNLITNYGPIKAKKLWDFVVSGVTKIKQNIESCNIDCDYQVQDSLYLANSEKDFKSIENEHQARKSLGYESTLYTQTQLTNVLGSRKYAGGVRYPNTFGINGFAYCQSMKQNLQKKEVQIYENTEAISIKNGEVITAHGNVKAKNIIIATDRFIPELGKLKNEIFHAQTFLAITKPLTHHEIKSMFPQDLLMVWDTDLIYQYYRITGDNRLLIGGSDLLYTYSYKEKHSSSRMLKKLEKYLKEKFSENHFEIEYLWPGLIGISKDFLPIAGLDKKTPGLYYIGAAAGLPWCAALGTYIADKIAYGKNDFDKEFSPYRDFPINNTVQNILGMPLSFAISHGLKKYFV